MSETNPYASNSNAPMLDHNAQKVRVNPMDLFRRAYEMMGEQYWLFVGITLLGI